MTTKRSLIFLSLLVIFLSQAALVFGFITETVAPQTGNGASFPDIAIDSNYIHVVWSELGNDGNTHIYYKRKTLTGSWSGTSTELVSTQQGSYDAENPKIKVDGTYVYVVWQDKTGYNGSNGVSKIVYKRKPVSGAWADYLTEVISTETNGEAFNAQIAIDSAYVYVTWEDTGNYLGSGTDRDIFFKRKSLDGTWPGSSELVSGQSTPESYRPVIAIDANNVYVAWYDHDTTNNNANIYFTMKTLGGTWPLSMEKVSTEAIGITWADAPSLAMAADGSNVHVAWRDNNEYGYGAKYHIVYKKKTPTGTWPAATEVVSTESTGISMSPAIGIDTNNVYVVWLDSSANNGNSNWHVFFKKKNINDTWGTTQTVISDESSSNTYNPAIAVKSDTTPVTVHMVWSDETDFGYGTQAHIVYRKFQSNPPQVTVTYPNGGETPQGTITVKASATDSDSVISSVSFYYTADNGKTNTLIGTVTAAPYQLSWDTTQVSGSGDYKIKAVVISDDGGQGSDLSDVVFFIDKYYDDTSFMTYTFANSATATCYLGTSSVSPLATQSNPGIQLADTTKIKAKDVVWESTSTSKNEYVFMKYNFKISQAISDVKRLAVECEGYSDGLLPVYYPGIGLYLWNNRTGVYDSRVSYTTESGNTTLATSINSSISDYIKADGTVQILLETLTDGSGMPSHAISLTVDFIKLTISTDVTAPAAVTDLKAESGPGRKEIKLTWTAPGDDGALRTATGYTIKYATSPFSNADWDAGFVTTVSTAVAPVPQAAGNNESLTLSLTSGTTYYFSLKTYDEVPNLSTISNQVSAIAKTNTAPVASISTPTATQNGNIAIGYTLIDVDTDSCTVNIAYSIDGGSSFAAAARGQGGDALTNLTASSTTATSHTFVWDSVKDIGETVYEHVQIRVIPTDSYGVTGAPAVTSDFRVNNTSTNDTLSHSYPYPNPFRPKQGVLTIKYVLNKDAETRVSIYNLGGELVKEEVLSAGSNGARQGTNQVTWEGKNQDHEYVASGVYVVCIIAEDFKLRHKIAVLK